MSSRSKKGRPIDKWAAKQYFTISSPEFMGGEKTIGETVADETDKLMGRILEAPLSDITGDYSRQHVTLQFQIEQVVGENAKTVFKGHYYTRDYLRFLVRRRRTRIDAIVTVKTEDNIPIRVTVTGFTTRRARTSHKDGIRKEMIRTVKEISAEASFEDFVQGAVLGKMGSDIYNACKKIYPLKRVEIQKTKVLRSITLT
ncbi:MAG: 30S ribosomal protein S3ae [Candidatus Heimdallarchaeota archaeon]